MLVEWPSIGFYRALGRSTWMSGTRMVRGTRGLRWGMEHHDALHRVVLSLHALRRPGRGAAIDAAKPVGEMVSWQVER